MEFLGGSMVFGLNQCVNEFNEFKIMTDTIENLKHTDQYP